MVHMVVAVVADPSLARAVLVAVVPVHGADPSLLVTVVTAIVGHKAAGPDPSCGEEGRS